MSEVRLLIRDARQSLYADRHGSFADSVIAALSADPDTIEELDVALERFIAPGEWSHFRGFSSGLDDRPYDAGLVIVDLAARLVVCDSTYCAAALQGCVCYHDGESATDVCVRYHLSDDWLITQDAAAWRAIADERRLARLTHPPLDARPVLYGEPLLKFIASECFESFRDHPDVAEADYGNPMYQQEYDLVRQIHVRWMMRPRDDLRGQTPRQIMIARREHVGLNLQDRKEQWSYLDRCPRGLDVESAAYRFGGFGTHEMVTYYEMVRHLLWGGRCSVAGCLAEASAAAMRIEDFVAGEVPRLAELREQWLDAPDGEFSGRTPRRTIHNERARLPEAVTGDEAMIDADCPLCQMQAEMPGPTFWNLDGCNMDDDFAFSMWHDTYEQWEQEQCEHEEFGCRWEAREAERKRLGVEYPGNGYADPDQVWTSSFSAPESPGQPVFMRLFTIGSHLCELIVDLRAPTEQRDLIDRLSRAFGNLREIAPRSDPATADALMEPVLAAFSDVLDAVATARSDLAPKCIDLQERLQRFREPPCEVDDASGTLGDDSDLPF